MQNSLPVLCDVPIQISVSRVGNAQPEGRLPHLSGASDKNHLPGKIGFNLAKKVSMRKLHGDEDYTDTFADEQMYTYAFSPIGKIVGAPW